MKRTGALKPQFAVTEITRRPLAIGAAALVARVLVRVGKRLACYGDKLPAPTIVIVSAVVCATPCAAISAAIVHDSSTAKVIEASSSRVFLMIFLLCVFC
jgi:hypothetical protein